MNLSQSPSCFCLKLCRIVSFSLLSLALFSTNSAIDMISSGMMHASLVLEEFCVHWCMALPKLHSIQHIQNIWTVLDKTSSMPLGHQSHIHVLLSESCFEIWVSVFDLPLTISCFLALMYAWCSALFWPVLKLVSYFGCCDSPVMFSWAPADSICKVCVFGNHDSPWRGHVGLALLEMVTAWEQWLPCGNWVKVSPCELRCGMG